MTEVLVKMCGLTREEDAVAAVRAGTSMIGLIFVARSPRHVDLETAKRIADAVRTENESTRIVGVFVDEEPDRVSEIVERVGLDLVQLHGDEQPGDFDDVGAPIIRVVRVRDETTPLVPDEPAEWVLYDKWSASRHGGTGESFDWSLLRDLDRRGSRMILSGGLTPDNVAGAIRTVQPDGVDVASGIEASPGIKDHWKIRQFMEQVRDGKITTR